MEEKLRECAKAAPYLGLQITLNGAADEIEALRARLAALTRERDSYRNEHRILEAKHAKVCDERDALTRENAALQESLDASRDTCASLTMDLVDERALAHDEGRETK